MSQTDLLDYTVRDRVAILTMNRPKVNAVNFAMIEAIHAGWRRADKDPGVRAVVLTSAFDGMFSPAWTSTSSPARAVCGIRPFLDKFYMETLDIQYRLTKPTIAALNGRARGRRHAVDHAGHDRRRR